MSTRSRRPLQLLRLQGETRRLLPDVRQPILIVQGKQDHTVAASAPQEIYDGVRSAVKELHWMENSGHCVMIDREWEAGGADHGEVFGQVLV